MNPPPRRLICNIRNDAEEKKLIEMLKKETEGLVYCVVNNFADHDGAVADVLAHFQNTAVPLPEDPIAPPPPNGISSRSSEEINNVHLNGVLNATVKEEHQATAPVHANRLPKMEPQDEFVAAPQNMESDSSAAPHHMEMNGQQHGEVAPTDQLPPQEQLPRATAPRRAKQQVPTMGTEAQANLSKNGAPVSAIKNKKKSETGAATKTASNTAIVQDEVENRRLTRRQTQDGAENPSVDEQLSSNESGKRRSARTNEKTAPTNQVAKSQVAAKESGKQKLVTKPVTNSENAPASSTAKRPRTVSTSTSSSKKAKSDVPIKAALPAVQNPQVGATHPIRKSGRMAKSTTEAHDECKLCKQYDINSEKDKLIHCLIHVDFKRYTCGFCSEETATKVDMVKHLDAKHKHKKSNCALIKKKIEAPQRENFFKTYKECFPLVFQHPQTNKYCKICAAHVPGNNDVVDVFQREHAQQHIDFDFFGEEEKKTANWVMNEVDDEPDQRRKSTKKLTKEEAAVIELVKQCFDVTATN